MTSRSLDKNLPTKFAFDAVAIMPAVAKTGIKVTRLGWGVVLSKRLNDANKVTKLAKDIIFFKFSES